MTRFASRSRRCYLIVSVGPVAIVICHCIIWVSVALVIIEHMITATSQGECRLGHCVKGAVNVLSLYGCVGVPSRVRQKLLGLCSGLFLYDFCCLFGFFY